MSTFSDENLSFCCTLVLEIHDGQSNFCIKCFYKKEIWFYISTVVHLVFLEYIVFICQLVYLQVLI